MLQDEPPITILGGDSQAGSYLLRLRVHADLRLAFGRFKRGKIIAIPRGEYLYIGSALGRRGSVSLARRLVRHATRTGDKSPHAIRARLLEHFRDTGLGTGDLLPKDGKHLFWNVDHLLDDDAVALVGVIAIRSEERLERELGELLEDEPGVFVIEKGLGANDIPGNTNLLRVEADDAWWRALPRRVERLLTSAFLRTQQRQRGSSI